MTKKNYSVKKTNKKSKNIKNIKTITVEGYSLASKRHKFTIKGESVSNIVVTDEEWVKKLVNYKVDKKYKKLIQMATDTLSDDDSENGTILVLDEVEKFRQEIKIRYRKYLEKEKLNLMAKQLKIIKKAAENKQLEIKEYLAELEKEGKAK